MRRRRAAFALLIATLLNAVLTQPARAEGECSVRGCTNQPQVVVGPGSLTASLFELREGGGYASNQAPPVPRYTWRLQTPCEISDPAVGGCISGTITCPQPPGRVVTYYVTQQRRLVPPNGQPVDGVPPPPGAPAGSAYGQWGNVYEGCVDVTDLKPAPSPEEVFRYFQTLPLPQLTTRQQPPGQALVGLPVIFFTDSPTTQTFTVDIRGFTVDITATATSYTWNTGDGTVLTTTSPGAPYPNQTITHDYSSGTYTAALTTTWGATYTLDGGAAAAVPGTTTTQGPPVTFTVRQAHTVLTNPYD
jgi:hypothetical protein